MADLWEHEEPVTEYGISVPDWIEQDINPADVAAINQGGCESGTYMPAVTYHKALGTMREYGDEVLDYIEQAIGDIPAPRQSVSWSGMACQYLSTAVELWASSVEEPVRKAIEDEKQ